MGLSNAFVRADVENLAPARVFPSVGPTAALSGLDAVVQGHGSLAYDFRSGVRAAEVAAVAGPGVWRFGGAVQAFSSAQVAANYAPATREVVLSALKVEAERTRLDLNGLFRLVPEDAARKAAARLEYRIAGPSLAWQEDLTRQLTAEPLLRPATADEVVRRVGELGPVVGTGHGPGHGSRTIKGLRWRRRRAVVPDVPRFIPPAR